MKNLEHQPTNGHAPQEDGPRPKCVPGNAGHPLDKAPLPFWLREPCPAWCQTLAHVNAVPYRQRVHVDRGCSVMLSLMPAGELHDDSDPEVAGFSPACADVGLRQHYRAAEPHLQFAFVIDDDLEPCLTLAEGRALAALLLAAADSAGDLAGDTAATAFWMSGPCPAWCHGGHEDGDHPDDRCHTGDDKYVALTMEDPVKMVICGEGDAGPGRQWEPLQLAVSLEQGWREAEARVCVRYGDDKYVDLTLAEARELAAVITALLDSAR
jgi:hypothetical protein